ncbi:MAG TPA: polysaccharide biosynthesis/export family protein [Xanthobacteraceae bacterium]|jgi:polysaccharide export outer membrane protein|nr:polysaccharide biosynthesis/export family protein [Xanthobacteraceae bacterium]
MQRWRWILLALAGAAASLLQACAVTPIAGPRAGDIVAGQADPGSLPYGLVRLTPRSLDILAAHAPQIAGAFADRHGPQSIRFGIGDVLGITIFEAGAGGLFIPAETAVRQGNYVTLPNQEVDVQGNISVPYAGPIRAQGRTAIELQAAIVDALKDIALKPQAVVTLVTQRASSFSVLGDVKLAGRFPALPSGERLLDAIARAGGLIFPGNECWVVFERDKKRILVPFGAIVDVPENNIYVRPNDIIYVYREPQTFLAFGASGRQAQIPFEAWRVSLAEALAKANGLTDIQADPAAVFLYRGEPREVAVELGVDVSRFDGPIVPVIYNLDLRDPAGYFLASKFEIRNKDVIYAANASSVEFTKFLTYVNLVMGTINNPIITAINVYTLKAFVQGTAGANVLVGGAVGGK